MDQQTDDPEHHTTILCNYPAPIPTTSSFYEARGMVMRSQGSYLKWHYLCTRRSLLVILSGAFCAPVICTSYLKWRLLCTTLGKTGTNPPTFQSGGTLTCMGPGTCSCQGGHCKVMNNMCQRWSQCCQCSCIHAQSYESLPYEILEVLYK